MIEGPAFVGFVLGPCFVMQYLVSFFIFAIISLRETVQVPRL